MNADMIIAETFIGATDEAIAWVPGTIQIRIGVPHIAYARGADQGWERWSPSTDVALWHGEDGLLCEIGMRMLDCKFMRHLSLVLDPTVITTSSMGFMWMGLTAAPAQLTAALVKMIEEETQHKP